MPIKTNIKDCALLNEYNPGKYLVKTDFIDWYMEDLSKKLREKFGKMRFVGGFILVTKEESEEIRILQNKNNYVNKS